MIPYGRQDISSSDIQAVVDVLQSDYLTQGPIVPQFETAVSQYAVAAHGIAVNSATSALHIACLALGVGPGDLVWTSPNTFVATANAVLYCGAKVDFVDIDPRTYNINVDFLEEKLKSAKLKNRLPKVIIPVHFAGQSCDMERIFSLANHYGVKIIEDASHAVGGQYLGKNIGCCLYSEITVFSFHPVKIITTGEGGMALTNKDNLADAMRRFRSHGILSDPEKMCARPGDEIWNYQQIRLGFNYRMTDLQGALGISQMTRIDCFVERRRKIAGIYNNELKNLPVVLPWQDSRSNSSFHLYPILVKGNVGGKNQAYVYNKLKDAGINVNIHYIPVYRQPYYENLGFNLGYCREAEAYFKSEISLPIYPGLSDKNQDYVIAALHDIFSS